MGVVGRCSYSSLALWLACTYIANDTKAAKLDCGFTGYSTSHATRLPGVQDGLGAKEAKSLKRPVCRVGNTWLGRGEMGEGGLVLLHCSWGGKQWSCGLVGHGSLFSHG